MPVLDNPYHEAFARARAEGLSRPVAFRKAGYGEKTGHIGRVASRPTVIGRIAELELEALWGGSESLKGVIDELMRLALKAGKLSTVAGMTTAKGLLCEAARLKLQMGAAPEAAAGRRRDGFP